MALSVFLAEGSFLLSGAAAVGLVAAVGFMFAAAASCDESEDITAPVLGVEVRSLGGIF